MRNLALIVDCVIPQGRFEVMLLGNPIARIATVELQDVEMPMMDLSLYQYRAGTGNLRATPCGELAEVEFGLLRRGRKHHVLGVAVSLPDGLDLVLPADFFGSEAR